MPHRHLILRVPLAAIALALVAACGAGAETTPGGGTGSGSTQGISEPTVTSVPSEGARPTLEVHRSLEPSAAVTPDPSVITTEVYGMIVADAAARGGVAPADVVLVEAEHMTWPNGALGCPIPGHAYTEALVPGARIVVEAGTLSLDYRTTDRGSFTLCEKPGPLPSASAGS